MNITREEANGLSEWLGSDDLDKLLTAREALGELGVDAVRVLRTFVHQDVGRYRAGKRRLLALSGGIIALCCCLLVGILCNAWPASEAAAYLLMPSWLMAPFFLSWYDSHRTCQKRLNHSTVLLRRMMPLCAIRELIEVMELGDDESAYVATKSLTELMPCLKLTDVIPLDERHHVYLHHALRGYDSYLILAILHTLEIAGDHRDIAEVERLTTCPEWSAQSDRIHTAARRCLSILKARAEEQLPAQTFLRMASAPTADSLLRPASHAPTGDPQQLLQGSSRRERE